MQRLYQHKNRKYMKKRFFYIALLALAAVGILSISSCEKEENNRLTLGEVGSVWQCSTEHYTITWTLLNDSTIYSEAKQDSGYYSGFGNGNMWYNYFIAEKGTDIGWTAEGSMFFITKMWNNIDISYSNFEEPYILEKLENSFTIDYTGIVPTKSNRYYLFKKIK